MAFLWRDIAPYVSDATGSSRRSPIRVGRRGVLAGFAVVTAFAMSGQAARANGNPDDVRKFVGEVANKATAVMADKALADAARAQQFRDLFVASFDLPAIGQEVLGRYWKAASPDQQTQFLKLFEQQQVLTWAGRFKSYNGEKLAIESVDPDAAGGWRIASHIDRPGKTPIGLEWHVSEAGGGMHIVDLAIEGVSMALTLRQEFTSVLQSNGGKLDPLLTAMQAKINQLSAS